MIEVQDLYDYGGIRTRPSATMFIARVERPTLVLGGSQSLEVLDARQLALVELRRRRGGGGLVLLGPNDLWVDWWVPAGDPRWFDDVRASALQTGRWWAEALRREGVAGVTMHEGPLEGPSEHRVVCFAGRGPGEVFVERRKTVGLTQWRVREGAFLSSVLHAGPTGDVIDFLAAVPEGLAGALDHHTLASLEAVDRDRLIHALAQASGDWSIEPAVAVP